MESRFEIKYLTDNINQAGLCGRWLCAGRVPFFHAFPARQVNNLYFDTADGCCFREHQEGLPVRAKLRLRWYGKTLAEATMPRLEVKGRRGATGWKVSWPIPVGLPELAGDSRRLRETLLSHLPVEAGEWLHRFPVPTLMNSYFRQYLQNPMGIRATIDENLHAVLADSWLMFPHGGAGVDGCNLRVFEMKFPESREGDARDILSGFPQRPERFSKYIWGFARLLVWLWLAFIVCGGVSGIAMAECQAPETIYSVASKPTDRREIVRVKGVLLRSLAALRKCDSLPGGEFIDALWHVHGLMQDGTRSMVSGSSLSRWLPPRLVGDDGKLSLLQLMDWIGVERIRSDLVSCGQECSGRWLWQELNVFQILGRPREDEQSGIRKIIFAVLRGVPEGELSFVPAAWSVVEGAELPTRLAREISQKKSPVVWVMSQSALMNQIFRGTTIVTDASACQSLLRDGQEGDYAASPSVHENGVLALAQALVGWCGTSDPFVLRRVAAIRERLPRWEVERMDSDQLSDWLERLQIRDDWLASSLGLKLPSPSVDMHKWLSDDEPFDAVVDHIIYESLSNLVPNQFVLRPLSVEDEGDRREMLLRLLDGVPRSGVNSSLFIYVLAASQGVSWFSGSSLDSNVREVRDVSTRLAAVIPALQGIKERIHNALDSQVLADFLSEKAKLPQEVVSQYAADFISIEQGLHAILNPTAMPVGDGVRTVSGAYLAKTSARELAPLLNDLNTRFLRDLTQGTSVEVRRNAREAYVGLWKRLGLATEKPADELAAQLRDRIERFRWFVSIVSLRDGVPIDYRTAVEIRLHALDYLVEKWVRDLGFQYLRPPVLVEGQSVRVMNPGEAEGVLVFVPKEQLARHLYRRDEILVTDGLPLNLGVTAALITEAAQPLASHIDLRTKERGTPNLVVVDARSRWKGLFGKWVRLQAQEDGTLELQAVAKSVAERGGGERKSERVSIPQRDVQSVNLVDLDNFSQATVDRVGAKAFGYAQLRKNLGNDLVARGVAIPFGAYDFVVQSFQIAPLIEEFLRQSAGLSEVERTLQLRRIRKLFRWAVHSPEFQRSFFMRNLRKKLDSLTKNTRSEGWEVSTSPRKAGRGCFRFRSSTNAEDLPGFAGAGLYSSATGCLPGGNGFNNTSRSIEKALGKVWGSLWTDRAFAEREHAGIDHRQVGMAILVHRNWPHEIANGVMLTRSLLDQVHLISARPGDSLVTNPDVQTSGDEVSVVQVGGQLLVQRGNSSDFQLSDGQISMLVDAGERVFAAFVGVWQNQRKLATMRFDLEFKFVFIGGNERLVIKQARPFVSE